jgi:hypothetical protein
VLVERNQSTQRRRSERREHDAVARAVALEHLTLYKRLAGVCPKLLADLLLGLAEGEGLGLCEEVGEQDAVVLRLLDRVERRSGSQEVGRDELGALVDELVEGMLAVGAGSTPDDRLETC